jgi:hypothetical protein
VTPTGSLANPRHAVTARAKRGKRGVLFAAPGLWLLPSHASEGEREEEGRDMRERQGETRRVTKRVETQDNVFTLRVFPGDVSTLPPLLDPSIQSQSSGSPLSRTDLTGGSTLLLPCQTQPAPIQRKGPVVKGPVRVPT